jgi:hypothetical protein
VTELSVRLTEQPTCEVARHNPHESKEKRHTNHGRGQT